jgi:hypothetical protein
VTEDARNPAGFTTRRAAAPEPQAPLKEIGHMRRQIERKRVLAAVLRHLSPRLGENAREFVFFGLRHEVAKAVG